jgi:hypothetical protein
MDELLDRLVRKVGVDRRSAEKAVGIILAFLIKEGPSDKVQALINQTPAANAVVQAAANEGGFGMGGIMGVSSRLMAAGLGFDQMQALSHEIIDFTRQNLSDAATDEIVAAIPGIGQLV